LYQDHFSNVDKAHYSSFKYKPFTVALSHQFIIAADERFEWIGFVLVSWRERERGRKKESREEEGEQGRRGGRRSKRGGRKGKYPDNTSQAPVVPLTQGFHQGHTPGPKNLC